MGNGCYMHNAIKLHQCNKRVRRRTKEIRVCDMYTLHQTKGGARKAVSPGGEDRKEAERRRSALQANTKRKAHPLRLSMPADRK